MLGEAIFALLGPSPLSSFLILILFVAIPGYFVYQTWLHPLAAYPDPFLAKLTNFYTLLHAIRAGRYEYLYRLHQRHGRVVRIGPQRLSILDAEAMGPIYGFQANVKKSNFYEEFHGISTFNEIDPNKHARKRRVLSHAFSDQALHGMEPHILSAILTRLTTAIRTAFPTLVDIVAGPRLMQLSYLRACIEESMRLCPPAPSDLPREVLPGGLQVGKWHIPAGTVVGVPAYPLHHSEEYFDRPFVYDPSRWLLRGSEGLLDGPTPL
ncbi:cytochrome P450 [Aspergillus heteromorphus CBS 117.55]|uniref:Cytochrome P450 n=1 Tax=Aspergillus heteromorphus CBS 117.55 TaxID=1448321 RepID=A0A317VSU4_9EURO|nr:cytochrome P450 [Aspergillus heteromorphus CBS 117.55]PWY76985.1 cytochrome P450 [Aspergillus heteromorphus CBS 117.55]